MRSRRLYLFCVLCLMGSWAATASGEAVTLQLKWTHKFQFAGYYAAIEKGYYREAGLEVSLIEGSPEVDVPSEVAAGRAQYGIFSSSVLLARAEGKPLVVLACIFQHSPEVLITRSDSGIATPHDLKGKRVAWAQAGKPVIQAMLSSEGMTLNDIQQIPRGQGLSDLISGAADVVDAYTTDAFQLDQQQIPYRIIYPAHYGIDFYGDCLFTSKQELRDHPQRAAAFRRASIRGWEYAMAHPEELIELIRRKYQPALSEAELKAEAAGLRQLMHPELVEIGHINPGRWQRIAELYAGSGMMSSDFPLEGFIYSPQHERDVRWIYWAAVGTSLVLTGIAIYALLLRSFNQSLRRAVAARTALLADANRQLQDEIAERHRIESDLKQAKETAEAASRSKDDFLSVLSHELRTPLTPALLQISQWEGQEALPAGLKEEIALVRRNVDLEVQLIDDLLDLTRIARGKLSLKTRTNELRQLIQEAIDVCSAGEGAPITYTPCAEACYAEVDPTRIRQVLWNLLNNARKFTPAEGWIAVRCDIEAGQVQIQVSDNGVGIEAQVLPRIFSAFEQGSAGRSRQFGGLGLGLTISKAIVVAHGGTLTAKSEGKGKGSTFTVRLPLSTRVKPEAGSPAPQVIAPEAPAHLRILLIEDHAATLMVLKRLIERAGHSVKTATSVAEALEVARSTPLDLVISDLGLPDGSGHDLMPRLKQEHQLPGIALSGFGMEQDVIRSREAGFSEHLTKPVDLGTLLDAIARAMAGQGTAINSASAEIPARS